ncbi:hypothetical protein BpHYR1_014934 [Brachionus plicatilis]|uniref:Uncharacterized protein n=1 Tax=Brachionus plicatilis TaxID=10195 RepID=A0A3M7SBX0_BRAPC|nr:hypothetical protein BpHYR1_014934 [Brachionus plicatilis]
MVRLVCLVRFTWYRSDLAGNALYSIQIKAQQFFLIKHRPFSYTYLLTWRTGFDIFVKYNHIKSFPLLVKFSIEKVAENVSQKFGFDLFSDNLKTQWTLTGNLNLKFSILERSSCNAASHAWFSRHKIIQTDIK